MQIRAINQTSKIALSALEKISEHGASFGAITSFALATTLRPLAISLAPDCEKENKEYAVSNSISSGLIKLIIAEMVAIPIESAIKKINKDPSKYLTKEALLKYIPNGFEDKALKFASQFLNLSSSIISAIPKTIFTIALIPIIDKLIFKNKPKGKEKEPLILNKYDPIFDRVINKNPVNFKGNGATRVISGILNNKKFADFAIKHSDNATNIARNMTIGCDLLLTSSFIAHTKFSKKIEEERKPALIYNSAISTGASVIGGYFIDNLVQKIGQKQLQKFIEANKNNPKLSKYIEGINILRPTIIFGLIYYGILPFVSTYASDKLDKFTRKDKQ